VTELRRGPTIGVSPWRERRAARRPWHGGVRGGGGAVVGLGVGGRKGKGVWPGGLAQLTKPLRTKRTDGLADCWAGWDESQRKLLAELKIVFLTLPRIWKFVQGDLGGILIWGFFLNSSKLLKDFRKI
jgi:hypothetical protein